MLFNLACKKKQTVSDLSAIVTGLLLALSLPAKVALWQCAVGAVFAIVVVKCLFGGIGYNFANPAVTARVFLLLAFSVSVGGGSLTVFQQSLDLVASATPLELIKFGNDSALPSLTDMFLGNRGGAIGETCALALIVGGIYLIVRKVIYWHTPAIYIATVFALSLVIKQDITLALYEVLGGGLLIAAFFMITDYVSTPINKGGKMVFAFGCGVITVLIRFWGGYPEGVSFAILLMNILSPYIEKLCAKKPFGKVGK
jgi:electron transport complex protein RnfD